MSKFFFTAALVVWACSGACASSPTAEETVAYMTFGLENGEVWPLALGGRGLTFRQMSSSPAEYVFSGPEAEGNVYRFLISKTGECSFDVAITRKLGEPEPHLSNWTFDFSHLRGIAFHPPPEQSRGVSVEFVGATVTCGGSVCEPNNLGDSIRIKKAADYFLNTFCGGGGAKPF